MPLPPPVRGSVRYAPLAVARTTISPIWPAPTARPASSLPSGDQAAGQKSSPSSIGGKNFVTALASPLVTSSSSAPRSVS
jgi:hypothetical protein